MTGKKSLEVNNILAISEEDTQCIAQRSGNLATATLSDYPLPPLEMNVHCHQCAICCLSSYLWTVVWLREVPF
jgi:hypothetical protein